jgi:hypothetical protein
VRLLRAWPASFLGWVLFIGICGSPAAAQGNRADVQTEGIQLGALVLAPGLDLVPVGIDTNILRDPLDPRRDIIAAVMPHLTASVTLHPFDVETSNEAEYEYFTHYSDQRAINRDHWLRARARLARTTLFASAEAIDMRERVNYDLDSRVRRTGTQRAAGGEFRVTAKTTIAAGITRGDWTYTGDAIIGGIRVQHPLQNRADEADASIRVGVTPLTTLFLDASQTQTRFVFSPLRDADSLRLTPGFETSSRLMSGRLSVGYERLQPRTPSIPTLGGVVADGDLIFPLGFATRLHVDVRRDLEYSYHPTDLFYVVGAMQGSIVHRVGRRWEFQAGAGGYRLTYRSLIAAGSDAAAESILDNTRVEYGRTLRSGVEFRVRRLVRVGAEAEYVDRRSPLRDRHYNELRANLFLRLGFAGERRLAGPRIYRHD